MIKVSLTNYHISYHKTVKIRAS